MIVLMSLGLLSLAAIAGTVVAIIRDGYGRRPTTSHDDSSR